MLFNIVTRNWFHHAKVCMHNLVNNCQKKHWVQISTLWSLQRCGIFSDLGASALFPTKRVTFEQL